MILSLLILLTAWLLTLVFPWWTIAIPGLVLGFQFNKKAASSFGWGFLALFLLWGIQATIIHVQNDGVLTSRVATMLGVNSAFLVILSTGLIGGLVSGMSTLTGSLFRDGIELSPKGTAES
jgi:hypothetical protein